MTNSQSQVPSNNSTEQRSGSGDCLKISSHTLAGSSEIREKRYSPTPSVNAVIAELLALGIAPMPVAPKGDPRAPGYHLVNTKDGIKSCPLDKHLNPISLFSGKNPSYLQPDGRPRLVKHKDYQTHLPSKTELKQWFAHPQTGVGAMCGQGGVTWIDFDIKSYASQEQCDQEVEKVIEQAGATDGWIEKTGSGGWRIAVKPREQGGFTNFSTEPGGMQRGEALGMGRFTVLAPTVHPNGTSYKRVSSGVPTEVESLESIGIYPAKNAIKAKKTRERSEEWDDQQKHRLATNGSTQTPFDFLEYEVLPRLSVYEIFNWAGHDFQECGKTLKGNPPWRQSASGTSFHVWWDGNRWAWQDKSTGEGGSAIQYRWKLRGGIGTPKGKDFYEVLAELAADAGLSLPEFQKPSSSLSPVDNGYGWWDDVSYWYARFTKSYNQAQGFETSALATTVPFVPSWKQESQIAYVPGKLPTFEEYLEMGSPKIIYKSGQRNICWSEMIQKGYSTILDTSGTGQGKSHDAGLINPAQLGVDQIFYLSSDHRSPTTGTVEQEYTDLPVRHNGLVTDPEKTTPSGQPHVRWPKPGETPDIEGNCFRTVFFHEIAAKGYSQTDKTALDNPICHTCPMQITCKSTGAPGASFRKDRVAAVRPKNRCHIDSLPNFDPSRYLEDEKIPRIAVIMDEAMSQINPLKKVVVNHSEFDKSCMEIQTRLPDEWEQLKWLLNLRPYLTGEIKQSGENYYGWRHDQVLQALGVPKGLDLTEIARVIDNTTRPDLGQIVSDAYTANQIDFSKVSREDRKGSSVYRASRAHNSRHAHIEVAAALESLPVRWLVPLLQVLAGEQGAFLINNSELTIATLNLSQREKFRHIDVKILMDATATHHDITSSLGIDPNLIAVCQQETPSVQNLQIVQITGLGNLGKQRSRELDSRVEAVTTALLEKHPNIGIIDHLSCKQEGQGHWFGDSRGSNRYQHCSAMLTFGNPIKNIGQIELEYRTLFIDPSEERLQKFIEYKTQREFIQVVGRLRAGRRPDEKLIVYVATEMNVDFLLPHYPGVNLVQCAAVDICPQAGKKVERNLFGIAQAFRDMYEQGVDLAKVTCQVIADKLNLSKGRISQICKDAFGSWQDAKNCLISLLKALYSKIKHGGVPPELDPELLWMAKKYFPDMLLVDDQILIEEVANIWHSLGAVEFAKLCEHVDSGVLLTCFMRLVGGKEAFNFASRST